MKQLDRKKNRNKIAEILPEYVPTEDVKELSLAEEVMLELDSARKKYADTWVDFVHLVEDQLGEKAIYMEYDEETRSFIPKEWKNHEQEVHNVYVRKYEVHDLGMKILHNNLKATQYKNVLALPDGKSFYGFSHRGGCLITIGDKIFDENYVLSKEDAKPYLEKAQKEIDSLPSYYKGRSIEEVATNFISFTRRGFEIADTAEKALKSAKNIGDYLS